jgi:iron complex outermembrane receptor protein
VLVRAGAYDIRAVQNLLPSVRFQAENASTELYIRGVGSTLDLPNIEPPNAFNFNGVYIPREGTSVGLFDLASVELLPGPQGTLYGRAALGGAVNVEFNRPTRQLATSGLLEVGDYSMLHGTLVQNLPVNDRLALRGAFDYAERDGYQATGADAQEDYAARLSALYAPSDALDVYVWLHGAKKEGDSPNLVRRGYNDGTFSGNPNAYDSSDPWDDRIDPGAPTASPQDYENFVAGAQLDWDLGDLALTYIPGYFYLDWTADYWLENIPALLTAHYNQVTNELRLASDTDSRLQWLGGLYQYRVSNDGDFLAGGFPLAQISHNRLEGYAVFGEAMYSIADTLRVVAGGRMSWDQREGRGLTPFGQPYDADESYDNFDWKIGVEWDVGAAAMAYATIQTGYQPGTYNMFPATPEQTNLVDSASMTAFTVGFKSRFLDDRLQLNDEVFYYDYEDLLVQSFNLNTAILTTFNAEQTTIWGNQFDLLFVPTGRDRLNLTLGYLNAEYDDFVVPDSVNMGIPNRDFGGYPLQNAPEWTLSAGYQHEFPLGPGRLLARLETRYEDSFWGTFAQFRGTEQQDYFKTDASVTYYSADERWSLGLWVRNIENQAVIAAATTGQFGPYANVFVEPPRTWGARFTFGL